MSDLREHLAAILETNGELTPALVVEAARPEDSPLHNLVFDVPPDQAAERYYLDRAHRLIRAARYVYKDADETGPARSLRAYHVTPTSDRITYQSVEEIAADPFMTRLVLDQMRRDWLALKRRYDTFAEFVEMVRADVA
jgi:hypothetical protein